MIRFPTLCVDDFYEDPDAIREFALSLPYDSIDNKLGTYPGRRTQQLSDINKELFDKFCSKLFSLYYDFQATLKWEVRTSFQLIQPFAERTSTKNNGWVHIDGGDLFGGIIYLTPNINPACGTSIFKTNSSFVDYHSLIPSNDIKSQFYLNGVDDGVDAALEFNNGKFTETARFDNIYNRLISFDANTPHAANSFYTETEPRLTQVFFVHSLETSSGVPLERCRNINL